MRITAHIDTEMRAASRSWLGLLVGSSRSSPPYLTKRPQTHQCVRVLSRASESESPSKTESAEFNGERFLRAANKKNLVATTRAAFQVAKRRIMGEVKEPKWSLPLEMTVEIMSATLPNILDPRLIKLYRQGDAETRSQVEAALEILTNQLDTAAASVPCAPGVSRENVKVGTLDAAWFTPDELSPASETSFEDDPNPVVLYFHGGAYLTASINTHTRLTSTLAKEAQARILSVKYR